ncbi:hypothetical protein LXL04_023899 [Taraxacum kok-saghyz]
MAYRVQNHSLDIMVPGHANSGDALFLDVDSNATPTCTYVPRQLSRDELLKLLPDKWVTNYEQIHQAPVQSTTAPDFIRHVNDQVELKFSAKESSQNHNIFPTVHMIQPTKPNLQNSRNHCWFDVCNCSDCLDDAFYKKYDETFPIKQHKLEELYNVGLLGDRLGKFDYYVRYKDSPPEPERYLQHKTLSPYLQHALSIIHKEQESSPNLSTLSCYVISSDSSTSTYQTDFPPLTTFKNPQQRLRPPDHQPL